MTQTNLPGESLFRTILATYHEGRKEYPKAIIAVEYDDAMYFLHSDAVLISDLFRKNIHTMDIFHEEFNAVEHVPYCIVGKNEHNDLSLVLYENKFLMVVLKKEETIVEGLERIMTSIRPYPDHILAGIDIKKIFGGK